MTTPRTEDLADARTQSPPGESVAAAGAKTGRFASLGQGLQQMLAFGTLIALVIIFFIASPNFLTISNLSSILLSTAVIGILAVGTTFVIITGGIDLSLGTAMTLCSVVTGLLLANAGLPLPLGVLGGIAMGALIGLVNGFNVAILGLPPFIATLSMMLVAQGLALVLSGVRPIYFNDVPGFSKIALGEIIPKVPNAVLLLSLPPLVAGVALRKPFPGRMTSPIGSNEGAPLPPGINPRRWILAIYT